MSMAHEDEVSTSMGGTVIDAAGTTGKCALPRPNGWTKLAV